MSAGLAASLPAWADALAALLLVVAAAFALVGSYALARLSDFYKRLHGPSKSTTLGVGCVLLASGTAYASVGQASWHELLITLFLFLSAPVSAHLLVRAVIARSRADGDAPASAAAPQPAGGEPASPVPAAGADRAPPPPSDRPPPPAR